MALSFFDRQQKLKRDLRTAFREKDSPNLWCRVTFHHEDTCRLVRLVQQRENLYSFLEQGINAYTGLPDFYLCYESEFIVHWVGSGPNACGCILDGEDMEEELLWTFQDPEIEFGDSEEEFTEEEESDSVSEEEDPQ